MKAQTLNEVVVTPTVNYQITTPKTLEVKETSETWLFVGAHPDDVELGCGGTIIKAINEGKRVLVAFFSLGERGLKESDAADRVDESIKALLSIGLEQKNIITFQVPDTKFGNHRDTIFSGIEKICNDYDVSAVFTHSNKEYHQDHIVVYEETLRSARNVPSILLYESNAHTYPSYSPAYFIDVSPYMNSKMQMLSYHVSQKDRKYFLSDNVFALAKFRGNQSRTCQYAEAFETVRLVVR